MATEHDFRIVFEEDGYPRELINAAERARAVREGALTPEMNVTVYRAGATPGVFKARDIAELKPLFEVDPPAPPPEPEPEPEPAREAPAPPPVPERDAPSAVPPAAPPPPPASDWIANHPAPPAPAGQPLWPSPTAQKQKQEEPPPISNDSAPSPPVREPGKYTFMWVLIGIILTLYLLATCTGTPTVETNRSGDYTKDDALLGNDVAPAARVDESGPAKITAADMSSSVTRYAVRETNIRQRPTAESSAVGKLARGAAVSGVEVPGIDPKHRWFKITSGDFAGYFVSADANISEAARPQIDTGVAGSRPVRRYAPLYAEADRSSRILQYAEPGTSLTVVGSVADGLAEVSLRSGAIAYVEQSAFEVPADPEADSAEMPVEDPKNSSPSQPRQVDLSRPATLQNKDIITESDYPAKSLRKGDTGTVSFRVEVTATGRAGRCRITRSSGHDRLDRTTCRLIEERARFDPARDSSGEAMPGLFEGSFAWRLN